VALERATQESGLNTIKKGGTRDPEVCLAKVGGQSRRWLLTRLM